MDKREERAKKFQRGPSHYRTFATVDVSDWLAICDTLLANGESLSHRKQNWGFLVSEDRLTCPETGEVAVEIRYEGQISKQGRLNSYHFNFYSDKGNLLTIDHIKPKAKGGDSLGSHNIQPMVDKFNFLKSDTYEE